MDAILTIIENDGTTRIVPWADISPLVRPDPNDMNDIVADLRALPKAYEALKREVLDLKATHKSETLQKLWAVWDEFHPGIAPPSNDPVALYRHALENLKATQKQLDEAEETLQQIAKHIDNCSADEGHGDLPQRVADVCEIADQASDYEREKDEACEALEEILNVARRVVSG